MKFNVLSLIFIIFPIWCQSQYDTIFHSDKINLLTVAVDYEDFSFSNASMNYYDCTTCTLDSLPYQMNYVLPGDFGSMTFLFEPSQEMFFHGTIVWMGQGQQSYPQMSTNTSAPFDLLSTSFAMPSNISFLDMNGGQMSSNSQTDLAWNTVSKLRIVQLLAAENYDVLCYLYAPSVGMFDPGPAKWMFFFYKNNYTSTIKESIQTELSIYPNPSSETISITKLPKARYAYEISNLNGFIVQKGEIENTNQVSVKHLENGVYFLKIKNQEGKSYIMKWLKN